MLVDMEVELMEGNWDGPKGAGYNECWSFVVNSGYMLEDGTITPLGRKALTDYYDEQAGYIDDNSDAE
jgi:hypothetical protein